MTKTLRKALSLVLSIVMVFALTMIFTAAMTAYAAITLDTAKQIALDDAGVTAADVVFTEARLDGKEYDIEFLSGKAEYDYSISNEGEITSFAYDSNTRVTGVKTLDSTAAKEAALNFIGINADSVERLRAEYDDGEYEVSFTYNNKEYDITVSAVDGTIIEYDYETVQSASGILAMISAFFRRILDFFSGLFA